MKTGELEGPELRVEFFSEAPVDSLNKAPARALMATSTKNGIQRLSALIDVDQSGFSSPELRPSNVTYELCNCKTTLGAAGVSS